MSTGTAVATTEETAKFAPARLPWHPVIEERFGAIGANKASWKALTEAVFPGAKTVDSIVMALSYCSARKLDPFKRPVHIVPMWDSQSRQMVETVWPGISEIRTTAFRTGQYAGCDEVEFGPMIERSFTGSVGRRGQEREVTITVTFPEWGRINVYRILGGQRCKFVSPKVYWLESYGRQGASDVPNDMWSKRPSGQLEKCVEAAGLRKAFPEEVGNDYTAEEMHGQALLSEAPPTAQIGGPSAPPPAIELQSQDSTAPTNGDTGPAAPPAEPVEDAEIVEAAPDTKEPITGGAGQPAEMDITESYKPVEGWTEGVPFDPEAWLDEARQRFEEARSEGDVSDIHELFADTANDLGMIDRQKYEDMLQAAEVRVRTQGKPEQAEVTGEPGPAPDEDDDSFPGDEAIAAFDQPKPSLGAQYLARIREAVSDPIRTQASLEGLWNATGEERKKLETDGEITKEQRKELREEIARRGRERSADAITGPAGPPTTEQDVTAYDRDFRAKVAACSTIEEINRLSPNTLVERNRFTDHPALQKEWQTVITQKRKQLSGIV